jgi:hypothetical protein
VADRALVRAEDPALDQRGDAMDVRQNHVRRVAAGRHVGDHVREAVTADVDVALPAIGVDLGAAGDTVEHEVGQRGLADVGDAPHAHPPGSLAAILDGDRDDRLAGDATARWAGPARLSSTSTAAVRSSRPRQHHRAAQLVQPCLRRLVAARAEDALQAQRRDALLLVDHLPDRREPAHQRRAGADEDRALVTEVSERQAAQRRSPWAICHQPRSTAPQKRQRKPSPQRSRST